MYVGQKVCILIMQLEEYTKKHIYAWEQDKTCSHSVNYTRVLMVNVKILVSQRNMDLIKCEPDPREESFLTCSRSDGRQNGVAQSKIPVLMGVSIMKTENEVICLSVCLSMLNTWQATFF